RLDIDFFLVAVAGRNDDVQRLAIGVKSELAVLIQGMLQEQLSAVLAKHLDAGAGGNPAKVEPAFDLHLLYFLRSRFSFQPMCPSRRRQSGKDKKRRQANS